MVKCITHIDKFLVIEDNNDGNDVSTYINVDKIVSIEFGKTIVAILCDGDVEYEWEVDTGNRVTIKTELLKIYKENRRSV